MLTSRMFGLSTALAFALGITAMAQSPLNIAPVSAAPLARPVEGTPLSMRQIEERTSTDSGKVSQIESTIYRDAAGRLRVETKIAGANDESILVEIVDPVARFVALLATRDKVALRSRFEVSDSLAGAFGFNYAGIPMRGPNRKTEQLGTKRIEQIDFTGIRTTVYDGSTATGVDERWTSKSLGLIGFVEASNSLERYSATIHDVKREEQPAEIFVIPRDYNILEIPKAH